MKKIIISLILLVLTLVLIPVNVKASSYGDLDIINEYNIKVDPRSDGTLDIEYHINWTVLDDESEGPLSWVKIGVANKHISQLENKSTDIIKNLEYYDDDGSFVRVDFKKKYYQGETVDFTFKLNQSRIFTLNDDKTIVEYSFIPGWFPDINVKSITIDWKASDSLTYITGDLESGYYHIVGSLGHNETLKADFAYTRDTFPDLNPKKDYISYEKESEIMALVVVFIIVAVVVTIIVICKVVEYTTNDGYDANSGFSGHYYWYYQFYMPHTRRMGYNRKGESIAPSRPTVIAAKSSSGHSTGGGGGSCACACACACAGGGRAGCSRKDFYNPDLEKIKEALDK